MQTLETRSKENQAAQDALRAEKGSLDAQLAEQTRWAVRRNQGALPAPGMARERHCSCSLPCCISRFARATLHLPPCRAACARPRWCLANAALALAVCVRALPFRRAEGLEQELQRTQDEAKAAEREHAAEQAQARQALDSMVRERDGAQGTLEEERRALQETRAALHEAEQRIDQQAGCGPLLPSPSGAPSAPLR